VLSTIAAAGINLSKLQSFPIPGTQWLYSFHADMEFNSLKEFNKLIQHLLKEVTQLKVYGIYESGNLKKQ
jgi:prephenate dehydratase